MLSVLPSSYQQLCITVTAWVYVGGGGQEGGLSCRLSATTTSMVGKHVDLANDVIFKKKKKDLDQQQSAQHTDTEHTPIHLYPKHVVYNF